MRFSPLLKKAKAARLGGLVGVLAGLIIAVFGLTVTAHYILKSESLAAVVSAVLVDLANTDREKSALEPLLVNPVLVAAAQAKADDMASRGYFAHVAPDGKNSWYWFKEAGYVFRYAGENLAVDFSDSAEVERAWMNSPTHRANILDGRFTEIGIAIAQGTYEGRPTTFVVQMFGTPVAGVVLPEVVAETLPAEAWAPAFAEATSSMQGVEVGEAVLGESVAGASVVDRAIASPKTTLRYGYYAIALLIFVVLALVTRFEFHKRQLPHLGAVLGLLALMCLLFALAGFLFFPEPAVASP